MAGEFIGVDIEGLDEVREKLKRLDSPEPMREMTFEVAKLIRTEMQKYPSPKHITRKAAYGVTFFSDKQRRFFFAALKRGQISVPYKRTQTLRRGWQILPFGQSGHIVANEVPYAYLVHGEGTQSRMMQKIGWKTLDAVVKKLSDRIRQTANKVYDRWIRRLGL